jgi:hypothetical protein
VEQADGPESLKQIFLSFDQDQHSLTSGPKRIWKSDRDRISWLQPNSSRWVSAAIKRQIVTRSPTQVVVITADGPVEDSDKCEKIAKVGPLS